MGQYRSNHPRTISNRLDCPSFRRRGRAAKSVYVAALEEFVHATGAGHGLRVGRQQCFHLLAYTCL